MDCAAGRLIERDHATVVGILPDAYGAYLIAANGIVVAQIRVVEPEVRERADEAAVGKQADLPAGVGVGTDELDGGDDIVKGHSRQIVRVTGQRDTAASVICLLVKNDAILTGLANSVSSTVKLRVSLQALIPPAPLPESTCQ